MTVITRTNPITRHRAGGEILVTGGAGFIGSNLVDALLEEGCWHVTVLDNFEDFYSPAIKRANLAAHHGNPNFTLYEVDIRHKENLRSVFEENKFDTIVHLASKAGVRPSLERPGDYVDTNTTGTLNLLECAREFGVGTFVFGSSSSVYGLNAKVPFSEECKTSQPISPYAASKTAAELLCHTYAHLYQIRCVCLRFFTVYGPRQRPDLAIHKFARLIAEGKPIPVFGDGSTRRDYTYVDDIIQGVRAALDYRGSLYEVFNLGESQTIELGQLIALLEQSIGRTAKIDRRGAQAGDMAVTYANVSKASRLLGYKPTTNIRQGIPKFVEWFLDQRA
ncbi:NAD-dependent epimerase/dehydratase family protein [Emericellopsis atlantica]|uniref:NAD-dependent epimerase/dehydratase family protein n=1 Tax=Emericellopsis atlantica TaxID=2614577 RepID=A0A9P8CTK1_9HYPO|nr:NAD-dependent epimerase/dehydratase family protein [Emericellopsis atlantica]KAG9258913.1 NAD-dependent epimerase/dehydratase family protein [Emericellopsis atlantica]